MGDAARQKFTLLILLIVLSGFFILAYFNFFRSREFMSIKVGEIGLRVEAAVSLSEQTKGLSGREDIGPADGMLFLYGDSRQRDFWMKDMLFSIDAIWINKGKVIGWRENILPPAAAGGEIIRFSSPEPADAVLELPAGWARAHNLTIGQRVDPVDGVDWSEN